LILEPTRELAAQVETQLTSFSKFTPLTSSVLIGGESSVTQEKKLNKGVDAIIATPGRLLDLFDRGHILLTAIEFLVIDEVDRMLDMGFLSDIERVNTLVYRRDQTLMFSATMSKEMRRLANRFLTNPVEVIASPPATTVPQISQYILSTCKYEKRQALTVLIKQQKIDKAIIFCNRKRDIEALVRFLTQKKLQSASLHGDMQQSDRTKTLEEFRSTDNLLLVASDIAGRGLDIQDISHVINFDVPINAEDYVHRIGRTGRAGREGWAFTLVTNDPEDKKNIGKIRKLIKHPISEFQLASVQKSKKPSQKAVTSNKADRSSHSLQDKVKGFGRHTPTFILGPVSRSHAPNDGA
jgi:superfamily II DNA/RNA helicase